jgi:hypothetical protein
LPDQTFQSAKTDDYLVVVIVSTRRLNRSDLRFHTGRSLALSAQFFHAGADSLEIVGSSGASHVSFPVRLIERSSPRPLSRSCSGSELGTSSSIGAPQLCLQF